MEPPQPPAPRDAAPPPIGSEATTGTAASSPIVADASLPPATPVAKLKARRKAASRSQTKPTSEPPMPSNAAQEIPPETPGVEAEPPLSLDLAEITATADTHSGQVLSAVDLLLQWAPVTALWNLDNAVGHSENELLQLEPASFPRRVSASVLAHYFHRNCQRYMVFSAIPKDGRGPIVSLPATVDDDSTAINTALRKEGDAWEKRILSKLEKEGAAVVSCVVEKGTAYTDSVNKLRSTKPQATERCFLYQAALKPPEFSFLNSKLIALNLAFTDLLQITMDTDNPQQRVVHIVDAKSSDKASHRFQIAIYYIYLTDIIKREGISDLRIAEKGGVWLKDHEDIEWFPLLPYVQLMDEFFRTHLQRLLAIPSKDAEWFLAHRCDSCDFLPVCIRQAQDEKALNKVAYISSYARENLHGRKDVPDIEDLLQRQPPTLAVGAVETATPAQRAPDKTDRETLTKQRSLSAGPLATLPTASTGPVAILAPATPTPTKATRPISAPTTAAPATPSSAETLAKSNGVRVVPASTVPTGALYTKDSRAELQLQTAMPRLRAVQYNEIVATGGVPLHLAKSEDIAIMLTMHTDPVTRGVTVWGLIIIERSEHHIFGSSGATASRQLYQGNSTESFVTTLWRILLAVTTFNSSGDEKAKSLQCYVFDSLHIAAIRSALWKFVNDPAVHADKDMHIQAIALLRLVTRSPSALLNDELLYDVSAANQTYLIDIQGIVSSSLALPTVQTYGINECIRHLSSHPSAPHRTRYDDDLVYSLWRQSVQAAGDGRGSTELTDLLLVRLQALDTILTTVRSRIRNSIGLQQLEPFELPEVLRFTHPLLSRMAFIEYYEAYLDCETIRETRMMPREVRILSGRAFQLVIEHHQRKVGRDGETKKGVYMALASLAHVSGRIPEPDFGYNFSWIITPDDSAGERAHWALNDAKTAEWFSPPRYLPKLGFVRLVEVRESGTHLRAKIEIKASEEYFANFPANQVYLLQRRFIQPITFKAMDEQLHLLDSLPMLPPFLALFQRNHEYVVTEWLKVPPLDLDGPLSASPPTASAPSLGHQHYINSLAQSQQQLFSRVLYNRLQLVWGPPGTGKTQFLAASILALFESHYRRGLPFRVLVSAKTHVAIENLLFRISALQRKQDELHKFQICKLKEIELENHVQSEYITTVRTSVQLRTKLDPISVVGGTPWAIRSMMAKEEDTGGLRFDALILDEASQVTLVEASMPLLYLNSTARIIMAGDTKQLGPIRNAEYPHKREFGDRVADSCLHLSVFSAVKRVLKACGPDVLQRHLGMLQENFRMNTQLCEISQQIYGSSYRAVSENALLSLDSSVVDVTSQNWLLQSVRSALHAPEASVVLLIPPQLNDFHERFGAHIEAQLTVLFAIELFKASGLPMTTLGHAHFWKEKLFVVTPQHIQRLTVRKLLRDAGFMDANMFVGTVEKMQGQEADTVLVCYSMWNEEAVSSSRFIYSLNRFNVGITRARRKCVVLLLESLLRPSASLLEDSQTARGFFYLREFVRRSKILRLVPVAEA